MTAIKRLPDLLRSFAQLLDRGIEATLCLVGDGPDREAVEELASELGVDAPRPLRRLPARGRAVLRVLRRARPAVRERGNARRRDRVACRGTPGRRNARRRRRGRRLGRGRRVPGRARVGRGSRRRACSARGRPGASRTDGSGRPRARDSALPGQSPRRRRRRAVPRAAQRAEVAAAIRMNAAKAGFFLPDAVRRPDCQPARLGSSLSRNQSIMSTRGFLRAIANACVR